MRNPSHKALEAAANEFSSSFLVDEVFLFESGLAGGPSVVSSTFEDVIWDAVYSIPTPKGVAVPKSHRAAMSAPARH